METSILRFVRIHLFGDRGWNGGLTLYLRCMQLAGKGSLAGEHGRGNFIKRRFKGDWLCRYTRSTYGESVLSLNAH